MKRGDHIGYDDAHFGTVDVVRDAADDEEGPELRVQFWCTADSSGQGQIEPSEDLSYRAEALTPCVNDSDLAGIIHAAEDRLEVDDPAVFMQFKREGKIWNCNCKTRIDIAGVISDGPARCKLQVTVPCD